MLALETSGTSNTEGSGMPGVKLVMLTSCKKCKLSIQLRRASEKNKLSYIVAEFFYFLVKLSVVLNRSAGILLDENFKSGCHDHQRLCPLNDIHRLSIKSSCSAHFAVFNHIWIAETFSNLTLYPLVHTATIQQCHADAIHGGGK